nr:MAG: hypothetical protein DIU75_24205 [Mycolicibacterium hassiacum]
MGGGKEANVTEVRIVLIVVGVGLILWGAYMGYRRRVMAATPTIGAGDVALVADAGREVRVEVTGEAAPGPDGLLTAPLSGTPCVWYRTSIARMYEKWETDRNGNRRQVSGRNILCDQRSSEPFLVTDVSGQVPVYPGKDAPDGAERVIDQREYARGRLADRAREIGVRAMESGPGTTRGHHYQEWVIRPGTQLYVLGAVRASEGIAIREPHDAPFIISTRDEETLSRSARLQSIAGYVLGALTLIGTVAWWIAAPTA